MTSACLKDEIASFLIDRKMIGNLLTKGTVAHGEAASLILQILGHADQAGPLSLRGMRDAVRKYTAALAASRPDLGNLRMEDGAFEVDLFPEVLNHFARTALAAQDMDEIYAMVGPPAERPKQKRRYNRS